MKNIPESERTPDDMPADYRLDYARARPNRFATKIPEGARLIILDPDIAEVFTTPESVNAVLRALIATMPKTDAGEKAA